MFSFFKKKPKSGYPRSFAKRLTGRIMLRMILVMIIPVFLLFWLTYSIVAASVLTISERILKGEKEEVRRIASDLYMAATNTAPFIEEDLDKPDRMYELMNRMLKLNPYMRSCGIYFIEGYYPQKGRLFAPYALRKDSTIVLSQDACDQGNDYVKDEWFKKAVSTEKGYWAKPFFDNDSAHSPLVSYLLPIRDKRQRTVAVLGVDLSLSWLNEKMQLMVSYDNDSKEWNPSYQVYYYMTDSTGTLLVHPDTKRLVKENINPYITKGPDNNLGYFTFDDSKGAEMEIDGVQVLLCSQEVKYTDWTIHIVIPQFYIDIFGYIVAGIAVAFILAGMLVVYIFGRRTIKRDVNPLKQLATTADEVAKGNFHTTLPPLKSHDEIHLLRDSFEQMQHSLTNYVEELKNTTAQKSAIESELKIAHDIQMSMLPKTFPPFPERDDIDVYGTLTPAKGVGGDLFDFHIRDERLFFCIGDVSGKGIPAALIMAVTRSLFRNISSYASQPAPIVYALNNALAEGNDNNMFVTLFVGVFDLQTGLLQYCNAGHESPLLVGRDVRVLPCESNLPVGVVSDFQYSQQEANIDPQTTIFLYTDGVNEAENATHAQFGDMRIQSVAKRVLDEGQHQPLNIIFEMNEAVHQFVNGAEQSDDLTMLAIQYKT